MDAYVAFQLGLALVLLVFLLLVGTFPFNAFLSAFFCCMGSASLALSLRMKMSMPKEFHDVAPQRAFAEFVFANLILFLGAWNFIG